MSGRLVTPTGGGASAHWGRRLLVAAGVVASLLLGAATIRAAAHDQIATDAATAEQLRAELAAAKDRLAKLEAALAAAPMTGTSVSRPAREGKHEEREHDGGHDDD